MLSPLRGGQWARARLASWRVGEAASAGEGQSGRASRTNNPYKVPCTLVAARKIFETQRRVKGAKHREAASP